MAETFASRLNRIDGLTEQEKNDYISRNKAALNEHFVPAYESLIEGLKTLKGKGTNGGGLCHFPEGKRYYEYLVNAQTGTSYKDIPSLKKAVMDQMADDLTAVDELLTADPSLSEKILSYRFSPEKPRRDPGSLKNSVPAGFSRINRLFLHH